MEHLSTPCYVLKYISHQPLASGFDGGSVRCCAAASASRFSGDRPSLNDAAFEAGAESFSFSSELAEPLTSAGAGTAGFSS